MSVLHHAEIIEDLKYWLELQHEQAEFTDLKRRGNQFYFCKDGKKIHVPIDLQDACRLCEMEQLV